MECKVWSVKCGVGSGDCGGCGGWGDCGGCGGCGVYSVECGDVWRCVEMC